MTLDSRPSASNPTPPLDQSSSGMAALVPVLQRFGLRVLQRRWKAIFIGIAGSLALAVLVTLLGTQRTWEATATLLYTPLPVPLAFQDLYEPPELSSVMPLALSRPPLEEIQKEFDLPLPVKTLRKLISVESSPGSDNMLEISFQWGDPQESAAMVNRMVELFRAEVTRVRRQALDNYYADLENHLTACKERLAMARKRLRDLSHEKNVVDADEDLESLQEDISSLEETLATTARRETSLAAQSKQITAHIEDLKQQETKKAVEKKKYEAAHESVADARRRQDRLRELIGEERRVMEVKAQLEAKRREYERAAVLVEKQLIPRTQFETIQGDMESLIARIKENEEIIKWKSELKRIDKTVVPKGKSKQVGSPIIAQVLFRKLELDLQILAVQKNLFQLRKTLVAKRVARRRLTKGRHEFQALEDGIDSIDDERRATEDRLAVLRSLRSLGSVEFSVISPAKPAKHAVKSNRKILLVGVFGLGIMLCTVGLLGLEIHKNGLMTIEDRLSQQGLTILGKVPPERRDNSATLGGRTLLGQKAVRQLALQIRQTVARPGAIILFSHLDDAEQSPALLAELAWCFARRDERVLIWAAGDFPERQEAFAALVDSEGATGAHKLLTLDDQASRATDCTEHLPVQAEPVGLADFLSFACMELDEFVFPSTIPGVDCLLAGQSALPPEGLATHRMHELLIQLRDKYSIILVDGPAVNQEDDLELLVACSDGIIFLVHDAKNIASQADKVISDLFELRAPILGAVVT